MMKAEETVKLQMLLDKAELTQTELAEATDHSEGYISQMLNGKRRVQPGVLAKARELARERLAPLLDGPASEGEAEERHTDVNAAIRRRAGR